MSPIEDPHPILDQPDKPPSNRIWMIAGYVAIGLMAVGLIMRYLAWPGAIWPVALSVLVMIVRFVALFPAGKGNYTSWLYLLGHLALIAAVVLYISGLWMSTSVFVIPALCYVLGMLLTERNSTSTD